MVVAARRGRVLTGAVSAEVRLAPGLLAPTIVASSMTVRAHTKKMESSRGRTFDDGEEGQGMDVIVERCAGLDVHKDTVMACLGIPYGRGGRSQELLELPTFTSPRALRVWLADRGVSQVALEATGVYGRPVWHVLEGAFVLLSSNAHT